MPPIDPADPTGSASEPHEQDDLFGDAIDIGVGGASPSPPRQLPQRSAGTTSPIKVVGALAAVIAVLALVVGLLSGGSSDRSDEAPLPAPTSPPEVLDDLEGDGTGILARPAPTPTVQVPVVSDGLLRAGETCRIPLDDDGTQVAFTVPDGRTMSDCGSDRQLLRDPGDELADALGRVFFSPQTLGLNLNQLRGEGWADAATVWRPVDNRRGYQLRRVTEDLDAWDRLDLIEVPGGTLMVAGRNRNYAPDIPQMIEELVQTIRVEGPEALPAPPLPHTGGWCGGDHFVTQVPAGWFAGEQCRWLNTSSESPIVLQCECLPPLWVEALDIPFDGDFGFNTIDVDRLVTRPDNSVIRIIEGLRRDANNMDRPLRVVVVDGGVKRVTVIATEFPEHALPGHTWQDTLDAQQFLIDNLRFHSQPGCPGEQQRLVVDPASERAQQMLVTGEVLGVPAGALVETTGCVDGVSVEVRLVAAPEVVGWMAVDDLAEPRAEPCPSGEREFRPHEWLSAVVGDFDGDGRDDAAYLRDNAEGGSDVAVLFANGGLAEGWGLARIDELPSVERYVGLGRDVLEVIERQDRGVIVSLLDASLCEVVPLASWPLGFIDGARHNTCVATDGSVRAFRTWSESFDDRQGWIVESDLDWFTNGAALEAIDMQWYDGPPVLCGPELAEFAAEIDPGRPGTELAGEHQLTLQWIEARDETTGTIEFTPIGNDRYEVDGVHEAAFGFLSMRGVIERVDDATFLFDGTISSQIPWLNIGDPCTRKAGQRFILRTDMATPTFRMQDRINCDGARTDWIDIQLSD